MAVAPHLAHPPHTDQLRGRIILVHYDIPGDLTWHARVVLSHVIGGEWVILTPDGDIYVEDISSTSLDIDSWRIFDPTGPIPPGVNAAHVYPFNPYPDQATLSRLLTEGDVYASMEKLQRGLPIAPPPAAAATAAPVAAVVAAGAPPVGGPPNLAGGGAPAVAALPAAAAAAAPAPAAGGPGAALAAIVNAPIGGAEEQDQEDARTLAIFGMLRVSVSRSSGQLPFSAKRLLSAIGPWRALGPSLTF